MKKIDEFLNKVGMNLRILFEVFSTNFDCFCYGGSYIFTFKEIK